jgi:uncharacterized UBP type Zn finger protein
MASQQSSPGKCSHLEQAVPGVTPQTQGCARCLAAGERWVALRMCLVCGHVGCCDSTRGQHATAHFKETQHAVMRSIEPGQDWRWCYVDKAYV